MPALLAAVLSCQVEPPVRIRRLLAPVSRYQNVALSAVLLLHQPHAAIIHFSHKDRQSVTRCCRSIMDAQLMIGCYQGSRLVLADTWALTQGSLNAEVQDRHNLRNPVAPRHRFPLV